MNKTQIYLAGAILVFAILLAMLFVRLNDRLYVSGLSLPHITSADFVSSVDNRFFPLTPGTRYIYTGEREEGTERTDVLVTSDTTEIMGVDTIAVSDKVYLDGELIEDTIDWYAQDKYGNVWYFGEDSSELADGKVISKKGSWQAGVDGAKPGIIMLAEPKVGIIYQQELYKGEAEDMAEVIALGEEVSTDYRSFSGCLKTRDWNPLEKGLGEYKYYCPGVGLVYEVGIDNKEASQLVNVSIS